MVECRRFSVGILTIYIIVSEILLLPVTWLLSWILDEVASAMISGDLDVSYSLAAISDF